MKELFYSLDHMYGIFLDEKTNRHVIEVECGDVGLYGVKVHLTDAEVAMFKKKQDSLKDLAYEITRDPEKFRKERGA
jgi:hypothetical protein